MFDVRRGSREVLLASLVMASVAAGFWIERGYVNPKLSVPFVSVDLVQYFHPVAVHMHRELRNGHFSLWNPHQMAGMPFLATHISGPAYPPNLVALALFPPARALEILTVLHLVIAGVLSWGFARSLSLGGAASLAAGIGYMMSGAMLQLFYSPAYLATCIWLPGVLWSTHNLVSRARPADAVGLAVCLSLAFLGGHAQGFLFEAQLAALYAFAALVFRVPPGSRLRVLALGCVSVGLVVGLCGVQLLPTLELLAEVPRAAEGLSIEEASLYSKPAAELLAGLVGSGTGFACGILTLPLLVLGLTHSRYRRQWIFFATAALGAGLFALGDTTPVFRLYHALPGGDLFRFPQRIAFVYGFSISVLVAIGVDGASKLGTRFGPHGQNRVAGAIALAVAVTLLGAGQPPVALPIVREAAGAPQELLDHLEARWGEGRAFVENFGELFGSPIPLLLGMMIDGYTVPTYEPMIPRAYTDYFGQDRLWRGFANVVPVRGRAHFEQPFTRIARVEELSPQVMARLLDLMSVRFYVTHSRLSKNRIGVLKRFAGGAESRFGTGRVIERPQSLPRAYVVHRIRVEPDPGNAREALTSREFAPHQEVVAGYDIPQIQPASGLPERAEIVDYQPEHVRIEAECQTNCLLVLTDLDYPGWHATVDGTDATIHRVNALFRGVALPSGGHEVVYRYEPASFKVGAVLSATTLCALAFGFGIQRFKRKRLG